MNKAIMAALILGISIATFHGVIELHTFDVGTGESSMACILPPLIAGLVAGAVVMGGTASRLKGLILAMVAVFIGALIGHIIGFYTWEFRGILEVFGGLGIGDIIGPILEDSIFNVVVAFVPTVIGVVIGKRAFKP